MFRVLNKYALHLAFLQAWTATLGSLYFSEILGLEPCPLCWYQRILMYPLVILFAVAIVRHDKNITYYALPLSAIGAVIALYQYLLQMTPLGLSKSLVCSAFVSCSQIDKIYFGFITIPFLSLMAFLVISILMVLLLGQRKKL